MNYEGQICRAPLEKASFMLPVTVGCPYNACSFCALFKHLSYRELPLSQIEEEIVRVHKLGKRPRRIFLGDGSAFSQDTQRLYAILELIVKYFGEGIDIHMDATVSSICKKSQAEMKKLYELGVRRLYIGIESGLDDVLKFMHKDHGIKESYEAIEILHSAGMSYAAHIMSGIAGAKRGEENAIALAELINYTKPEYIVNFSLFIHKEQELYREVKKGNFKIATELENIKEDKILIEHIDMNMDVYYDAMHDFVPFRVRGYLPKQKKDMLSKIDAFLAEHTELGSLYSIV